MPSNQFVVFNHFETTHEQIYIQHNKTAFSAPVIGSLYIHMEPLSLASSRDVTQCGLRVGHSGGKNNVYEDA
jgi:hypothetical protein